MMASTVVPSILFIWLIIKFIKLSAEIPLLEKLSLPQLKAFKSCSVHIITVQVQVSMAHNKIAESSYYELDTFNFPVIRQIHLFNVVRLSNNVSRREIQDRLKCGESLAILDQSKSNFIFRSPPSPRHNCIVQVYIDPPNCPSWQKFPSTRTNIFNIFGETMLDTVIDHRLAWASVFQQTITCKWIFVYCTKLDSNSEISQVDSVVGIMRGALRNAFHRFTILPFTIAFKISHEASRLQNILISHTFIVTEIGAIQESFHQLKENPNLSNASHDPELISQLVNNFSVYKWNEYSFTEQTNLEDLIRVPSEMFHQINFIGEPITRNTKNIYVTNFDWKEALSIGKAILALMIKPNITTYDIGEHFTKISPNLGNKIYDKMFEYLPSVGLVIDAFHLGHVTIRDRNAIHFVSCVATGTTGLSLRDLVSAFDTGIWILIFISGLATIVFTKLIPKYSMEIFDSVTFLYAILLRQGIDDNKFSLRILLCSWFLTGIVVSSGYEGKTIGTVVAPPEPIKVESFEEIAANNFTVYSPVSSNRKWIRIKEICDNFKQYSLLGSLGLMRTLKIQELKAQMQNQMWSPSSEEECQAAMDDKYFDKTVGRCENSAFVADFYTTSLLHVRLRRLFMHEGKSNHKKFLTISKKPLEKRIYSFDFKNFPLSGNTLPRLQNKLMDAGLPQFWTYWDSRVRDWNYTVEYSKLSFESPEKLSLSSNISAIFISMVGLLLFVALPILFLELKFRNVQILGKAGKTLKFQTQSRHIQINAAV